MECEVCAAPLLPGGPKAEDSRRWRRNPDRSVPAAIRARRCAEHTTPAHAETGCREGRSKIRNAGRTFYLHERNSGASPTLQNA